MGDELKDLETSINQQKLDLVGFEYRVDSLEKQFAGTNALLDKLDSKMDSILERLSAHNETSAVTSQKLDVITRDYDTLLRRMDNTEEQLNEVKVGVAKKIAYGAGGGAAVAALTEVIKLVGN